MALFSDILLTVDFDRTLTDPNGQVPRRNLEAIQYFMDNGGTFTVNTGRSYVSLLPFLQEVPVNAPLLLMNGSGCYENGEFTNLIPLSIDVWPVVRQLQQDYPDVNLELQNLDMHYLIDPSDAYCEYYRCRNLPHKVADASIHCGPFLKIGIYGDVEHREEGSEKQEKAALFDRIEAQLRGMLSDDLVVLRATPQIINIHAKAASKYLAARNLKERLGKKILVCVGDEGNDVPMLQGADYAFCPCDGAVADQFPNVCSCAEGAVADVIYNRLPAL